MNLGLIKKSIISDSDNRCPLIYVQWTVEIIKRTRLTHKINTKGTT